MKKIIIVLVIILLLVGAYFYFTRPLPEPTEDIVASSEANQLPAESTTGAIYRISQENSKVQFSITETLRGSPFTAVGTTNQVAGDFSIATSPEGKSLVTIGTIKVDASTLKTDSPQRDGAIGRLILKTTDPANQYITFTPTEKTITLSNPIVAGVSFTLEVKGEMTVSGVTMPETFSITATQNADGTISGNASATLKRSDFKLVIPNIPFVANVADSFSVSGTFVANKVE